MSIIASHLTALVEVAARRAGLAGEGVVIEPCMPTKDPTHGDYQSNAAFRLCKGTAYKSEQAVALLKEHFPQDPAVARVEIAGKGFLNLTLADEWLAEDVTARSRDERLGAPEPGAGKTLVIDYSSPNIAKRMHVGHLRSTLIGGAFDRIFRFLGWTVIADNHLGDWGTPYGKLMVAWKEWRNDAAYREDPIGELDRLYRWFGERAKEDPTLLERARQETVRLQNREPATLALWKEFVERTMVELRSIYDRLGCRFDVFLGESAYADDLGPLLAELEAKGFAEHSKGGLIVRFEEKDGKGLSEQPLLVRKADGAALYSTTDLATIRHRVQTWSPARAIYVVDARQSLHFRQVFAAARKVGLAPAGLELVHVGFGILRLPDGGIVTSRSASRGAAEERGEQSVNLVDVLDTAAQRAFAVVTEKNPELPEAERRQIAEVVGVGTIKYFDLSQNPQSDITFDWDRALSLDGGSAVYLQYAYARMHSILRKAGVADKLPDVPISVAHPSERALAVLVARTPEVILAAAEAYRPNLLADHLEALVQAVGRFYESCPVLRDDVPQDLRERRLSLVHTVAHTLRIGLSLLGIGVVPRM
jgi:arginyl-tRNA synthetase